MTWPARSLPPTGRNVLSLTDIAEHRTYDSRLYLCANKEVYSSKIAGYSIEDRVKASPAAAALHNAIGLRNPAGTVVHSDRGSQFRVARLRPHTAGQRAARIDGKGRRMR